MTEPTIPKWLIEAADQTSDTWIPLTSMPGVPGPVKVSLLGLVSSAYLAGWDAAREQFAAGVPAGARILTAEQWEMLRTVLCDATDWSRSPVVPTEVAEASDAPAGAVIVDVPQSED